MTQIEELLKPYIDAPVECDGFTRIAHTRLRQANIEHQTKVGSIELPSTGAGFALHFWIELSDSRIVDYRCQFIEDACGIRIPQGIFASNETPLIYRGVATKLDVLTEFMISILIAPWPEGFVAKG